MPDEPGLPTAEELAALPHAELAERLAEAYRLIAQLHGAGWTRWRRQAAGIPPRRRGLRRRTARIRKKPQDRSLREQGKRRPGKQPGEPGTTMRLVDDPDERLFFPPAACRGCGAALAGEPVAGAAPPPGHRHRARAARRGSRSTWRRRRRARAAGRSPRASCPRTCGRGPASGRRRTRRPRTWPSAITCPFTGRRCCCASWPGSRSPRGGWPAVRGKAAVLIEGQRVRGPGPGAAAGRAGGARGRDPGPRRGRAAVRALGLHRLPDLMHTGDRSADAIDAGGVLPGYAGIIVRDGYTGYAHLTDALHAWCGAHLLRDLKDLLRLRARHAGLGPQMAPCSSRPATPRATPAGPAKPPWTRRSWQTWSPATGQLAAAGLAANLYRRTATARDARRIARRFLSFEDMILRFATRPDLDIFTNNEAERTIRPVKVQQRSSGGCWRTIEGLADFAVVQSYLSTAAKWGIGKLDALRDLFNGHAWIPPGLEPAA